MAHFFKKEWIEHKEAQLRLLSYTPSCLLKIGLERAVVASDTRGLWFNSSHWQKFIYILNICLLSAVY